MGLLKPANFFHRKCASTSRPTPMACREKELGFKEIPEGFSKQFSGGLMNTEWLPLDFAIDQLIDVDGSNKACWMILH